jgi:hypothetical protein
VTTRDSCRNPGGRGPPSRSWEKECAERHARLPEGEPVAPPCTASSTAAAARKSDPIARRQHPARDAADAVELARKRKMGRPNIAVGPACSVTDAVGSPGRTRCAHIGHRVAEFGTVHSEDSGMRHLIKGRYGDEASLNRIPRVARVPGICRDRSYPLGSAGVVFARTPTGSAGRSGRLRGPSIAGRWRREPGERCPDPAFRGHRAGGSLGVTSTCSAGWWASVADSVATHTGSSHRGVAGRKYGFSVDR